MKFYWLTNANLIGWRNRKKKREERERDKEQKHIVRMLNVNLCNASKANVPCATIEIEYSILFFSIFTK